MLSKNNGSPVVCVNNLVKIVRGENPYERVKGININLIGMPLTLALDELEGDAEWLIETYEPRATVESIEITPDDAATGQFTITANIAQKEGE